jgi:hypothetical protein
MLCGLVISDAQASYILRPVTKCFADQRSESVQGPDQTSGERFHASGFPRHEKVLFLWVLRRRRECRGGRWGTGRRQQNQASEGAGGRCGQGKLRLRLRLRQQHKAVEVQKPPSKAEQGGTTRPQAPQEVHVLLVSGHRHLLGRTML